jgi:hypothetical protein
MRKHSVELKADAQGQATAGPSRVVRGAETWQFFAFVFAAVVTLALAVIDEIPDRFWPWRIAGKVFAFGGLTYLMLWPTSRVRICLASLLGPFKEERQ